MPATNERPVFLDLLRIRLPVGGLVSILHRITGTLLILLLPWLLYGLQRSLASVADYAVLVAFFKTATGRLSVLALVWLCAQHFFSGLRHLLLDLDVGTEKSAARRSAWFTFVAAGLTTAVAGAML